MHRVSSQENKGHVCTGTGPYVAICLRTLEQHVSSDTDLGTESQTASAYSEGSRLTLARSDLQGRPDTLHYPHYDGLFVSCTAWGSCESEGGGNWTSQSVEDTRSVEAVEMQVQTLLWYLWPPKEEVQNHEEGEACLWQGWLHRFFYCQMLRE